MKKLSVLFLSVLALGMTVVSCNNDDDAAAAPIEGKWNLTNETITALGVTQDLETENSAGCNKNYYEIKTGGVVVEGTYDEDCTLSTQTGTWSVNGSKITLKFGDETEVFEVPTLTDSSMTLSTTYTESNASVTYSEIYTRS